MENSTSIIGYSLDEEYCRLEGMIRDVSGMLERLVRGQGRALRVNYARRTMFLCLVRQVDKNGLCYGVRWAKFRLRESGEGRIWYNGWLPGRVPLSTTKKMEPFDYRQFRELEGLAKSIISLRKELTARKKQILGIFQVMGTHSSSFAKIEEQLENFLF